MAARIVLWVLTLGILAVIHLSVTKESYCKISERCITCKNFKANKDDCIVERRCVFGFKWIRVCLKHPLEDGSCGIQPPGCHANCVFPALGLAKNEGKWPWMVSLQTSSYDHMCGGVLLFKDFVLTAANCVHKSLRPNAKDFIVVLGEFDLKQRSGKEKFHRIKHIIVHPKFHPSRNTYNVALIQLENDPHYNEYISPICLPSFKDVFPLGSCSITGWGYTKGTRDNSRLSVRSEVVVLPTAECQILWPEIIRPKHHMCLQGRCIGDSGSPLSCVRSSDGRFAVVGVASWGDVSCQKQRHPSVYTNIRTFVPWIIDVMNRLHVHSTKETP